MPRPIRIDPRLSSDEIFSLHRKATDPVQARRLQVVWLASTGKSSAEIMEATGFTRDWLFKIVRRYNEGGEDALLDRRANNGGHSRLLTEEDIERLRTRLLTPPDDGGMWTSPKVAAWLTELTGHPWHFKLAWAYLKRIGYVLLRPRPVHLKSNPEAREAFKKGG